MEKGLAFKEDVYRRISEKTGMDIVKVRKTCDHVNKRMLQILDEPDCLKFYLPYFGYIYPNAGKMLAATNAPSEKSTKKKEKIKLISDIEYKERIRWVSKPVFMWRKKFFKMEDWEIEKIQNER